MMDMSKKCIMWALLAKLMINAVALEVKSLQGVWARPARDASMLARTTNYFEISASSFSFIPDAMRATQKAAGQKISGVLLKDGCVKTTPMPASETKRRTWQAREASRF
jgi:hypothetical protein